MVESESSDYTRKPAVRILLSILAEKSVSMPKAFCIAGAVVAILLLLVFVLDLGIGFPFDRQSLLFDIGMILCSGMLGYLSWATYRTLKS